jgi:tricorn protease
MSQTQARDQRYLAWVRTQRALVTKLSRGQLGYAHLRTMKIGSLDQFERDLFAHAHGKRGLILDLRNNSGGWIADLLLTMFFPRPHAFTRWRGSFEGYPVVRRHFYSWHKPTVLLINERSYSNSEIFAHAFKNLKRGLVIGMPSFGGVISATSDYFLDGSRFRLPFRGWWTIPSKINMENNPVIPDIIVTLSPQEELTQQDPQLIRAIHVLLAQTKKEYTKNR